LKPIGLQLYTVREYAEKDLFGTLEKVADIGFKGVEFAGLYGHKPSDIAKVLNDLGLKTCAIHDSVPKREDIEKLIQIKHELGCRRVVSMFGPDQYESAELCKEAVDRFNEACEMLGQHGILLCTHNHWWEFKTINGRYALDILMDECPNLLLEADLYWAKYAKMDPAEQVARFRSRIPLIHAKDGVIKEPAEFTAAGAGEVDLAAGIKAADPDVLEWVIVELDEFAGDMWDAVRESYRYLTKTGLAEGTR